MNFRVKLGLELGDKLCQAAWNGDLDQVKLLLDHVDSGAFINSPNSRGNRCPRPFVHVLGQTPLYCASRQGFAEIVCRLINHDACLIDYQVSDHGGTALHGLISPFPLKVF